jgi:hypothetical protein
MAILIHLLCADYVILIHIDEGLPEFVQFLAKSKLQN